MTITPTNVPDIGDSAIAFGGADPLTRFPPVREYIDTFQFSATFIESDAVPLTISSVDISPIIDGITTGFSGNTINISGTASNVFTNKYYQFKMADESIKILPPNTTENFYGIIKYQPDFTRYVEITYTITFTTVDPLAQIDPYIAMQTVNNDWESNRLLLKQLVAQGQH